MRIRFTLMRAVMAVVAIVCVIAHFAVAAGSAFVNLSDHDPFLTQYNGTVNGNGYFYALNAPILTPGVAFLNKVTGGASGGASGNVLIADPNQGQTSLELVAIAVHVKVGGQNESLTNSGDASVVANDLNAGDLTDGGIFPLTAYAYSAIPAQYSGAAAVLSAQEQAFGAPFDLLLVTTVGTTSFGTSLFWDFDLAGELASAGGPFNTIQVTDIGVIPEPSAAVMALVLTTVLPVCRRHRARG